MIKKRPASAPRELGAPPQPGPRPSSGLLAVIVLGIGTANWTFGNPNIMQNEDSYVLLFSSPNVPEMGFGVTIDGGGTATEQLPNPSSIPLPEPGTIGVLALAGGMLLRRR